MSRNFMLIFFVEKLKDFVVTNSYVVTKKILVKNQNFDQKSKFFLFFWKIERFFPQISDLYIFFSKAGPCDFTGIVQGHFGN